MTLIAALIFAALPAFAAEPPKLPVIQQVGVIPVQWEGDVQGYQREQRLLAEEFPAAVRASRRFRVINDDLVAGLWKEADGREEMKSQFELHGFASLTVVPRQDTVSLVARLMNANLSTQLLESETVSRAWLVQAERAQLKDRVERLVFRLFNRLPVDVSVTSIQGSYVTLSGGKEQGVETGDHVDLIRARIRSIHPATGAWLAFDKQPLGTAKVIEVKSHTSVAKLLKLTYEGAVEVGDGARIPAIAGRVKFARSGQKPLFAESGDQETIIVPPLYQGTGGDKPALPKPKVPSFVPGAKPEQPTAGTPSSAAPPQPATTAPGEPQGDGQPTAETPKENVAETGEEDTGSPWADLSVHGMAKKIIDSVTLEVGPYWWSVKGPRSASGRFPVWLVNRFYLSVTKTLFYKIKVGYGGGGMLGQTSAGRYYAYDSHARIYWEGDLALADGFVSWWQGGGQGRFTGMSVEKEKYGGGDWVKGGGFAALGGNLNLGPDTLSSYDWYGEFLILPLNVGRLGYDGGRKTVESSMGWVASVGAWQHLPPGTLQFGGSFTLGDERQTISEQGKPRRMHYQEYSLQMMMRFDL